MSRKRETTFYTGVNKILKEEFPRIYMEKMFNPLRGGTPDMFYEWEKQLWCEYKYEPMPLRDTSIMKCHVSPLQNDWLTRNYDNGHKPIVIIGSHINKKPMGMILVSPTQWQADMSKATFVRHALSCRELAREIATRVGVP